VTVPGGDTAAWVSRRVIEGERPGYVERTSDRINEFDSGWRFYVGDESQEYLDAAENCVMRHLGHALELWPEVATLVTTAPAAGEWIWDDTEARFRPLEVE
jgi:hypothetical protein